MANFKGMDTDARREFLKLEQSLHDSQAECSTLREQLEGKRDSIWWVQAKVWRQQKALDLLNRRVVNQRFVLRSLEDLGRGLTRDEFLAAREQLGNEQVKNLIETPAA